MICIAKRVSEVVLWNMVIIGKW